MIDIIIPGYNCRDTLPECLDSLCCQSIKKKLNVIFVDDCSEDECQDILNLYLDSLNIVYLRTDINRGPGYCRQLGLNNSKSEFVMFMDVDDLIADVDSLETLLEAIKQDCDYVSSLVYNESADLVLDNSGDLHGKVYRRSFLRKNKIEFSESRLHEDNLFNSLVLLHEPRTKNLCRVTYFYLNHTGSLSDLVPIYDEASLGEYIKNISVVRRHFADAEDNVALQEFLDTKYYYLQAIYSAGSNDSKRRIAGLLEKYNLKPLD